MLVGAGLASECLFRYLPMTRRRIIKIFVVLTVALVAVVTAGATYVSHAKNVTCPL